MLIFSMLKNVSNQNFLILKLSKRVWTQKKPVKFDRFPNF